MIEVGRTVYIVESIVSNLVVFSMLCCGEKHELKIGKALIVGIKDGFEDPNLIVYKIKPIMEDEKEEFNVYGCTYYYLLDRNSFNLIAETREELEKLVEKKINSYKETACYCIEDDNQR